MSSLLNQGISAGQAGYGLTNQVERALHGDPKRVAFVADNVTLCDFDACLNESHSIEVAASEYGIEGGQTISDHLRVSPVTLQLSLVKTDTPIDNRDELLRSAVVSAAAAVAGPLGILGAAAAVTRSAKFTALQAQNGSQSPSQAAYATLSRMAAGSVAPNGRAYPQVFDVVTSLRRYPSMCIRSLQVARDASTGYGLVFNISLQELRIVSSQTVAVTAAAQPAQAAVKKKLAEPAEGEDDAVAVSFRQGGLRADDTALGKAALRARPD